MLDIIRMEAHVQHVETLNIVQHDHHHVKQQIRDIMLVHHLVRQHVRMHLQTQNIQVMDTVIIVVGDVKHDIIRMEAHVQHVLEECQVQHDRKYQVNVTGYVLRDIFYQVEVVLLVLNVHVETIVQDEHTIILIVLLMRDLIIVETINIVQHELNHLQIVNLHLLDIGQRIHVLIIVVQSHLIHTIHPTELVN